MAPRKAVQEQAGKKIHVCDGNGCGALRPLQNQEVLLVLLQEVRPVWILEDSRAGQQSLHVRVHGRTHGQTRMFLKRQGLYWL